MLHSRYKDAGTPPRRSLSHRPAARAIVAAVAVALVAAVMPGGPDAGAAGSNERARREEVRQQKAAAAAQVNALSAENAELEGAVAAMNAAVAAQEARVADARRATEEARAAAERLTAEAEATGREVDALEQLVRDRAVQAYIGNAMGGDANNVLLDASDPTDLELRKVLLETVNGSDRDAIDRLAQTRAMLLRQREQVAEAIAEAQALEVETQARLDELDASRSEQVRLQQALQARIGTYQSEVNALAAEEANITAIIRQAEAAAAAAAAAAARSASSGGGAGSVDRPASSSGLIWPVSGPVTSGYGMRWGAMHQGIDIAPPYGTPIYAANSGTVIWAGWQGGYGNLVLIDHGGGFVTAYGHMSSIGASTGQSVGRGTLIGNVGSTGDSTGPHLHFETRVGGAAQNPMSFLP
jgi:murein DD-endopeptidase MepM/ murein hydrolase activator NlpD